LNRPPSPASPRNTQRILHRRYSLSFESVSAILLGVPEIFAQKVLFDCRDVHHQVADEFISGRRLETVLLCRIDSAAATMFFPVSPAPSPLSQGATGFATGVRVRAVRCPLRWAAHWAAGAAC